MGGHFFDERSAFPRFGWNNSIHPAADTKLLFIELYTFVKCSNIPADELTEAHAARALACVLSSSISCCASPMLSKCSWFSWQAWSRGLSPAWQTIPFERAWSWYELVLVFPFGQIDYLRTWETLRVLKATSLSLKTFAACSRPLQ